MEREFKKTYRTYTAWNYDDEEAYMNRMSEAGWHLVEGGCFKQRFEKNSQVKYRIRIDFNSDIKEGTGEMERYKETFKEQGWEYINSTYNGWHYFRKEVQEGLTETDYKIYTDKSSLREMLSRWYRIANTVIILLAALTVVFISLLIQTRFPLFIVDIVLFVILLAYLLSGKQRMKQKMELETKDF